MRLSELDYESVSTDFLDQLREVLDWPELESMLHEAGCGQGAQLRYPAVVLLKSTILQNCYALSDRRCRELLADRVSWRSFVGLELNEEVPNESDLRAFRGMLVKKGVQTRIFESCKRQLEKRGYVLRYGVMREARLTASSGRRDREEAAGPAQAPCVKRTVSAIPRIIHQSYKTVEHPYPAAWQQSWIQNHPEWTYIFHTDADNRHLVATHFPEFLEVYDAFPSGIMRADFARFLYLYHWGGVYADLDYVCLQPLDELIQQVRSIGIPELPENVYYKYHNALLISEAGNPFWLRCVKEAVLGYKAAPNLRVEQVAGPLRLEAAIETEHVDFVALSPQEVTPLDWCASRSEFGQGDMALAILSRMLRASPISLMRAAFPEAYAVTFWDHQW